MEKDDEIKGEGNSYEFGNYLYDPRVGRRFNMDPRFSRYQFQSPYVAFNNNPILFADPSGKEGTPPSPEKVIKSPDGNYVNIPRSATVENFTPTNNVINGAVIDLKSPVTRSFTVDKNRYIAGFDKSGQFTGYYLSSDMTTKYSPETLIYSNDVNVEFTNKVLEICYKLDVDPQQLMAIMRYENGGNWSADRGAIKDKKKNIIGVTAKASAICSMTDDYIAQYNKIMSKTITRTDVAKMTQVQQLEIMYIYTKWVIESRGKIDSMADLYMAIHMPAYVDDSDEAVIHHGGKNPSKYWDSNSGMDSNNDGKVTKSEAASGASKYYTKD